MKSLGVIPARYGSTRFPGKPLKLIAGKPLLSWVVEAAQKSKQLSDLVVATDHEDIAALARRLDVKVEMTESDLPSGTDRVWKVAQKTDADVIINIQGDEPLLRPELLDLLVETFHQKPGLEMATLARTFNSRQDLESPNTAKVLLNERGEAIYFSRYPIPFSRLAYGDSRLSSAPVLKHIGIYGFSRKFLQDFCFRPSSDIEKAEGLEQLRALSMGAKIQVVQVDYESWGVDTPEDIAKVEARLK